MRVSHLIWIVLLAVACAEGEPKLADSLGDPGTQLVQPVVDGGTMDAAQMDAAPMDATPRDQDQDAPTPIPPVDSPDGGPPPDDGLEPDPNVNRGWIGGPCERDEDCDYPEEPGGFCLTDEEGYPRGTCSIGCDRFCPDRDGVPVTFCIDEIIVGQGACVQRCDYDFFPATGCRPGYFCESRGRYNEGSYRRGVCVPGEAEMGPDLDCFADLDQRGINYTRQAPRQDSPRDRPDITCDITGPVTVDSPIAGVNFRYVTHEEPRPMFMSCYLAAALHRMAQILREFDVVEVGHIGTYNCRLISGTDSLSQHGLGLAIDLKWFRRSDGLVFDVEDHWEHGVTENFQTEEARLLYELAWQMHTRQVFNIILTPEFNAAHDNHFHVDLTEGAHTIRHGSHGYHFGPNIHGD